jgi:hypothetical protein
MTLGDAANSRIKPESLTLPTDQKAANGKAKDKRQIANRIRQTKFNALHPIGGLLFSVCFLSVGRF